MEHVLVIKDLLDNYVMKLHHFVLEIVLVMVFVMKDHVFVFQVFGKVMHVTLKFILVQQVLTIVLEMENVLQLLKQIQLHGLAHVSTDFVVIHVTLFVVNAQTTVLVKEFAPMGNVLVILDSLEMIVLMLNQFILVPITAQEEDIANKQTQLDTNVSVTPASQDLIVRKQQFSVQETVLVKAFVNVMELVHVKVDTLELLVNK